MRTRTTNRDFLALLGGIFALGVNATNEAQDSMRRIGFLTPFPAGFPFEQGFGDRLRELGYEENRSIAIDWRRSARHYEDLPSVAKDLVHSRPDIIVTMTTPAARAAQTATNTIPIVFTGVGDAVATGLVQRLSRPSANATGVSTQSTDLTPKRLDLLLQLAPHARRIGSLQNLSNPSGVQQMDLLHSIGRAAGVKVETFNARSSAELEAQLHAMPWKELDALLVGADSLMILEGAKVARAVRMAKLPAVFPWREQHVHGVLMSYGPNLKGLCRRAADYVDRIMRGSKPSELPVEQVSNFELIIDSRVARSMGIKIPDAMQYRADEVIR
jgi:putative ABC transport system substrate-binding protein